MAKRFFNVRFASLCLVSLVYLPGCGERVLVDEAKWLQDGQSLSWKLNPGTYRVELTANNDGASVEWVGAPCTGISQSRAYSGTCQFTSTGQIIVSNPTIFGGGLATSVTIKVTQLGH